MHMLLLVGISVGFVLSLLTSNNFYAERAFASSVNHVMCKEIKSESCQKLIAQAFGSQGVQENKRNRLSLWNLLGRLF